MTCQPKKSAGQRGASGGGISGSAAALTVDTTFFETFRGVGEEDNGVVGDVEGEAQGDTAFTTDAKVFSALTTLLAF
jgi:hypothetical protein